MKTPFVLFILLVLCACGLAADQPSTGPYAKSMVGKWQSPRHLYIYSANGAWRMDPEYGTSNGKWRVEGDKFITTSFVEGGPPIVSTYKIVSVTKSERVFTDGKITFREKRVSK